jgi:UDP-N-acetylglucosamine--dolichyl-phosphate N-acetylglucosaminephosphotransferase
MAAKRVISPESQGLVVASVYILSLILFIPFAFTQLFTQLANAKPSTEGIHVLEFPHHQVGFGSVFKLNNALTFAL